MTTSVKKWGNSAAVRIPSALLEAANLSIDQPVELRAKNGRIVIEAVAPVYDLARMVAAITPANSPPLMSHRGRVGAETIEW